MRNHLNRFLVFILAVIPLSVWSGQAAAVQAQVIWFRDIVFQTNGNPMLATTVDIDLYPGDAPTGCRDAQGRLVVAGPNAHCTSFNFYSHGDSDVEYSLYIDGRNLADTYSRFYTHAFSGNGDSPELAKLFLYLYLQREGGGPVRIRCSKNPPNSYGEYHCFVTGI